MVLTPSILPRIGGGTSRSGIVISIVPGDVTYDIEVQRTVETSPGSGVPDAGVAVSIVQLPAPILESGVTYTDALPVNGTVYFYRAREAGIHVDPGAWSGWTAGAAPITLDLAPAAEGLPAVYPVKRGRAMDDGLYPVLATSADGKSADRTVKVDGQGRTLVSLASTPELLPNGEFDVWESASQPHAWTVDTGDSSSCAKDATVVFSGDFSAKYSFGGGGSAGTYRGFTTNDLTKGAFCMPLRPGVSYRIKVAARASVIGAGESYRLTLTFDAGGTLTTQQVFAFGAATTWQVDTFTFVVPTAAEPNSRLAVEFTRGNTTAHDFWVDSLRVVEDVPAADLVNQLASAGQDFLLNGGFEQGFAYWRKRTGADTNPVIETSTPYAGAKAFKSTGAATPGCHLYLCDRQSDPDGADPAILQGNDIYVKVQPLDEIHVSAALKTSASSLALAAVTIDEYDANKGFVQTTNIVTLLNTTTWTVLSGGVVLQATTYFIVPRLFCGGTSAVAVTGYLDEVHMWRVTPKDRCLVYQTAAQAIVTATATPVNWDAEDHDVGPLHDNVTANTKIIVKDGGYGRMVLFAQIEWAAGTTGYRRVQIKKNNTTFIGDVSQNATVTIDTLQQCRAVDQRPAAGDYYEVIVTHTQGVNLNVMNGRSKSFFAAQHIY